MKSYNMPLKTFLLKPFSTQSLKCRDPHWQLNLFKVQLCQKQDQPSPSNINPSSPQACTLYNNATNNLEHKKTQPTLENKNPLLYELCMQVSLGLYLLFIYVSQPGGWNDKEQQQYNPSVSMGGDFLFNIFSQIQYLHPGLKQDTH